MIDLYLNVMLVFIILWLTGLVIVALVWMVEFEDSRPEIARFGLVWIKAWWLPLVWPVALPVGIMTLAKRMSESAKEDH